MRAVTYQGHYNVKTIKVDDPKIQHKDDVRYLKTAQTY